MSIVVVLLGNGWFRVGAEEIGFFLVIFFMWGIVVKILFTFCSGLGLR